MDYLVLSEANKMLASLTYLPLGEVSGEPLEVTEVLKCYLWCFKMSAAESLSHWDWGRSSRLAPPAQTCSSYSALDSWTVKEFFSELNIEQQYRFSSSSVDHYICWLVLRYTVTVLWGNIWCLQDTTATDYTALCSARAFYTADIIVE